MAGQSAGLPSVMTGLLFRLIGGTHDQYTVTHPFAVAYVLEVLMGERTLRGARLGGQSFEDERGIEFAARQQVGYRCAHGHEFEITMSVEADVPALWECPRCGAEGRAMSGIEPEVKDVKPARTHWDMLLERRSIKELEDILTERLELLRGGEIGPAHLHRASARKKKAAVAR
jgi:rubredoxin